MEDSLLIINAGSSSIKFALYASQDLEIIYQGELENILNNPQFILVDAKKKQKIKKAVAEKGFDNAFQFLFNWLNQIKQAISVKGVGHRVVHGGTFFKGPCLIHPKSIEQLLTLNPLAPLHQPLNIAAIQLIKDRFPDLPQVACFDTTFHQTQSRLVKMFALPKELTAQGIIRYGFHGLSYEYIASQLPQVLKDKPHERVIIAHLGHGSSMCAVKNGKSVSTSMGFTALDGLMMGTRTGTIDPGVLLYLAQEKKYSIEQINQLLYKKSGLLGVSGISSDMRELQSSQDANAAEAIDLYCYKAAREFGALCVPLKGCDALIFTGGVGENSALVRKKIVEHLDWFGAVLDEGANVKSQAFIHHESSKLSIGILAAREEYMIAKHTRNILMHGKNL